MLYGKLSSVQGAVPRFQDMPGLLKTGRRKRKSFAPLHNNARDGNEQPEPVIEMDERASGFPQSVSGNVLEKNMKCAAL